MSYFSIHLLVCFTEIEDLFLKMLAVMDYGRVVRSVFEEKNSENKIICRRVSKM